MDWVEAVQVVLVRLLIHLMLPDGMLEKMAKVLIVVLAEASNKEAEAVAPVVQVAVQQVLVQ